jgi:hypothetical protein
VRSNFIESRADTDRIHHYRQRLVEILNNGGFSPPIIVFVNQKKTADMVAKDLQRAHVSFLFLHIIIAPNQLPSFSSGVLRHCILESHKSKEKRLSRNSGMERPMYWLPLTSRVVVSMFPTYHSLSTSKCRVPLKLMCIVLVCNHCSFISPRLTMDNRSYWSCW